MEYYNYLKSLHLIFVITWFAGLFYIVRLFVYQIEANDKPSPEKEILQKAISGALVRTEKKITALESDLKTAENAEYQKIIADTLMSNIYMIKKGETSCTLNNIYTNEMMEIALSPLLTPVENAQVYYKRYNKYKRAIEEINKQKQETKDLLQYLQKYIQNNALFAVKLDQRNSS